MASSGSFLTSFDWTSLPATMVTEFIVANLQALSDDALASLVQVYRQVGGSSGVMLPAPPSAQIPSPAPTIPTSVPTTLPLAPPPRAATVLLAEGQPTVPAQPEAEVVKEEPVDPLAMNIDNEEMEYEPDKINDEVLSPMSARVTFADQLFHFQLSGAEAPEAEEEEPDLDTIALELREFKLPLPRDLEDVEREALVRRSFVRLWEEGRDGVVAPAAEGANAPELWMLLLVRMITRVTAPLMDEATVVKKDDWQMEAYVRQDRQRQTICDYIMADFPRRCGLIS
jgi:symplekin